MIHRTALSMMIVLAVPGVSAAQAPTRTVPPPLPPVDGGDDVHSILGRYVAAWRGADEMELEDTIVVGFDITDEEEGEYHIVLPPEGAAELREGRATSALVVFETDRATLRRLDRGELNALTAMAQARSTDPIPLIPRFDEDFEWTPEAREIVIPLMFHFWNREWPEIIRFGAGTTRTTHGGNMAALYYDTGLRTAWGQIEPGMHVNADAADQTNPLPSLFVMTRGAVHARLDGRAMMLHEGETVFVPAGMTHEFWAEAGEYGEFILLMFGDGA